MQLNSDSVEMYGKVVASTDKGVLIAITDIGLNNAPFGTEEWFPKSQLEVNLDVNLDNLARGQSITFRLPSWIALERGIFDD